MNINEQGIVPQVIRLRNVIALVVVLLIGSFVDVSAQWTNGTDITNTNSGNVGIGKSSPAYKLDVLSSSGTIARFDSTASANTQVLINGPSGFNAMLTLQRAGVAQWLIGNIGFNDRFIFANAGGNEMFTIQQNGNVGIGWASPSEKLVTVGNMLVGNITSHTQLYSSYDSQTPMILELGYSTPTANITPLASLVLSKNLTSANNAIGAINFANSSIANGNEKRLATISGWTDGATNSGAMVFNTSSTGTLNERMRIGANGRVGVGTSLPTALFHIMTASGDGDALRVHRNGNMNGWGVAQFFALNNSSNTPTDYAQISGVITSNTASAESGVLAFYTRNAGTLAEKMRIHSNGNVSIGTDVLPSYKLHVQGGSINSSEALCINGDCRTSWAAVTGPWTSGSGSINYNGGSVGIGISSPVYSLDVNGGVNGFRAKAASAAAGDTIATFENNSAIKMIVRADGKVGIGTTSPGKTLDVNGDINAVGTITGGTIQAKYQDVAEWVDSSQLLSAGTVVVLDPDKNNQVVASTQSYDSRVAGVISPQPGITLGERGEGRVLVAATGRVKVKVDASNGPIKIGDLLVTSDKEGFAMKSVPVEFGGVRMHRPGTLIGKALEPLASGTGEILVLLSLQ